MTANEPRPAPDCVVVGDGLAGASVAASLAARGLRVRVLGSGAQPASGASGLPAGVLAPHVSAADLPVSQLTRWGVAFTLERARSLLREGVDYSPCGVLERRIGRKSGLGPDRDRGWPISSPAGSVDVASGGRCVPTVLSTRAQPERLRAWSDAAHADRWPFVWHATGGWLRPAALVHALLRTPGVEWTGSVRATAAGSDTKGPWIDLDGNGPRPRSRLRARHVVLAGGALGVSLLQQINPRWALFPVRGQVSLGSVGSVGPAGLATLQALAPTPVNGHGSWLCDVPLAPLGDAPGWICGSTFERRVDVPTVSDGDHQANLQRLQELFPAAADAVRHAWDEGTVQGWAGVRCTTADRLPVVGPVDEHLPGLWVCTAMGSRGLSLSGLCGEVLASRICGEPPWLPAHLSHAMDSQRTLRTDGPSGENGY